VVNRKRKGAPFKLKCALSGVVDAKCYSCSKAYRIGANSWKVPEGAKKPTCECGGPIYLADPSLVVTKLGSSGNSVDLLVNCR